MMKTIHSPFLVLCMAILLCSCSPSTNVSTDDGRISADGKSVTLRVNGLPNAEITAAGDLSIGDKTVTVNAAQRALLQSYHHEMNAMTADGIAIGKQGAALAGKAVTEAIKGAISGKGDDVEGKVKADARKIEQQAMQLCKRLVTVKASQDTLALSLPEFKPYATLSQSDVDKCGPSQNDSDNTAKEIKDAKDGSANMDAAQRADAAAAVEVEAAADDSSNTR